MDRVTPSWELAITHSGEHTQVKRKTYRGVTEWE